MRRNLTVAMISLALVLFFRSVQAQEQKPASRFSHKGIKAAIGVGRLENDFGEKLDDGAGGLLNLGYGFDDHFTLWMTALVVEH
ncbi:MAG TPA: hypothetical protein VGA99_06925, partial [bacterium]